MTYLFTCVNKDLLAGMRRNGVITQRPLEGCVLPIRNAKINTSYYIPYPKDSVRLVSFFPALILPDNNHTNDDNDWIKFHLSPNGDTGPAR